MKRHWLIPILFAGLAGPVSAAPAKPSLAITGVTVIDVRDGSTHAGLTVLVRGERIERIGAEVELPSGAKVVDASGKYLIPGLWDMHVHWYAEDYLPLFVANGVTGVRQMFGAPLHHEWRAGRSQSAGRIPRQVIASRIVDGPKPVWPMSFAVADEAEGRAAVRTALTEGADFIKVYSLLSRNAYLAIADEAKKAGVSFAGHVPITVSAADASDAGQESIEHLSGVLLAASREEDSVRRTWSFERMREITDRLAATYDTEKAGKLFKRFADNETWHCPTLTVLRNIAALPDPAISGDPALEYMPASVRATWNPNGGLRWMTANGYNRSLRIVGEMRRAGVRILAGTDALNPYCFPGFSLHGELELLVQAGLSPLEALQAATLNPADFLDARDRFGTVEQGKIADLVLLEANPLDSIGNTRKIAAVVSGGKIFERSDLDRMLAEVKALAQPARE